MRLVLPIGQWAGLLAARPGLRVPPEFAVRAAGPVSAVEVDGELGGRRVDAVQRMLDVVDAAPIRVHVASWGQGRAAAAIVCVGGDRAVTLATAGPDPDGGAGGKAAGKGTASAPSWIEVSALWGGDVLAEVMRAGHPDLDGGSVRSGSADDHSSGARSAEGSTAVDAVASLAWATAMREGDAGALQALLSRVGLEDVPEQVRAAVDGLVGVTIVRVEVVRVGEVDVEDAHTGWLGIWLATSEGTLALRLEGAASQAGAPGEGGERIRMWWTAPGEVSRDVVVALTGAYSAALGPEALAGPMSGGSHR